MIDTKQSFRKGSVIVVVHVELVTEPGQEAPVPVVTRVVTDYKSINAAKKANRLTKYRTVPVKAGVK